MARNNTKRRRLTHAARRLIHANGLSRTTLSDIASDAEVPLGNIYYYFKTKDALAQAVIEEQLKEFRQLVRELERLADPQARIDAYLNMLVLESETTASHGCPVGGLCTELNKSGNELAGLANKMFQDQLDWLTRQFQLMGKAEEASDLALQLLSQLQGIAVLSHVFKDPGMFTQQIVNTKSWLNTIK